MKFNWGFGIVVGYILFISFILFFVIRMSSSDKASHDLVTQEYYKDELGYQKEIDLELKAMALEENITVTKVDSGLQVQFPKAYVFKNIKGNVFLYRPSNKKLDFDLPIVLSSSHLLIPEDNLLDGRWNIKIEWSYKGENYMFKKNLMY